VAGSGTHLRRFIAAVDIENDGCSEFDAVNVLAGVCNDNDIRGDAAPS
jgi:hypothetical protein